MSLRDALKKIDENKPEASKAAPATSSKGASGATDVAEKTSAEGEKAIGQKVEREWQGTPQDVFSEIEEAMILASGGYDDPRNAVQNANLNIPEEQLPDNFRHGTPYLKEPTISIKPDDSWQLPPGPTPSQIHVLLDNILDHLPLALSTSLFFVSISPKAGKTTTLIHLAVALAEHRVGEILLLDSYVAEPDLSRFWKAEKLPGLSDILQGRIESRETIIPTPIPNVSLLPAGMGSPGWEKGKDQLWLPLLGRLKQDFRIILVDGMDLQSSSDAQFLARHCDATYLVASLGRDETETSQKIVAWLQEQGVKVLGCILTGTP